VAKSKLDRTKSAAPGIKRSSTSTRSNNGNMKVYIPEDYYKHAGYNSKKSEKAVSQTTTAK
jgi:hypothetical protein